MSNIHNTDEKCQEIIDRLLAISRQVPEGNINRFFDKEVIGFDLQEQWMDFRFLADETKLNVIGTVHGGIMAGIADECMGFGAAALIGLENEVLTTADMQFNCLKAIRKGDELRIRVRVRHAGKRTLITTAEIFRDDVLVFMATENLARIPKSVVDPSSAVFG